MPRAQFGLSSYKRGRGDLPDLPVINMFADEAPTEETGVVLQSRPGLGDAGFAMGAGPVESLFLSDAALASALFGVSDGHLWSGGEDVGAIDGAGPYFMDAYADRLFIAGGGSLWTFAGGVLSPVPFPDDANVTKVLIAASRVIALRKGSDQFYWSNPLDVTIDALDFATAENQPDRLLDALFINSVLVLFGSETIEFWPATGNNELPFRPLEGQVIERGIRNTGACCHIGPSFAWVTNEHQVCVQTEDNVISNTGLQARIAKSETCKLFRFTLEGNEFLALQLDDETQVYSRRSGMWSQFSSYGLPNWVAQCWASGFFGGADGSILQWSSEHSDAGAMDGILERRFRAGTVINSGGTIVSNVSLRTNPGTTPFLTGDYTAPVVEMRQSRDNGHTWSTWKDRSLGEQGQYRKNVQWRACGMASRPGWLAEFRVTDPVPFRVSDVLVNEPYGGR